MHTDRPVLVALDPASAGAEPALREALRHAAFAGSPVLAVHVVDTVVLTDLQQALTPMQQGIHDALVKEARAAFEALLSRVPGAKGVALEVLVASRVQGILAAAERHRPGLLVIGAQTTPRPEVGLGSIATSCVRHAPCPVLVVRDDHPGPYRCVVAAVDFSEQSVRAMEHAARLAVRDGAALHALHVLDAPPGMLSGGIAALIVESTSRPRYAQAMRTRLEEFVARLGPEVGSIKPTLAIHEQGGHRSGIIEYAGQVGADLIVLGTRGRGGENGGGGVGGRLRDLLLGSTAEKVLRDSRCSVLAVRE